MRESSCWVRGAVLASFVLAGGLIEGCGSKTTTTTNTHTNTNSDGAAPLAVSGPWTGFYIGPTGARSPGIRFTLYDQDGGLTGTMDVEDPKTKTFVGGSELLGSRTRNHAQWATDVDVAVTGDFHGDQFSGTIVFPAEPEFGVDSHSLALTLNQ